MKIPKRIASVVMNSLKGGVVPRIGLPYVTVGRKKEIEALLHDVELIAQGGASFRFIVGKYGAGKSFLLQTIRNFVLEKGFVVVDADLSPDRRLQGTKGQGLATYRELVRNLSTKTRPEGGALTLVLDRWIGAVQSETAVETGLDTDSAQFEKEVEKRIYGMMHELSEMVHGFDFAKLLCMYYKATLSSDEETRGKVAKWFRGEYENKTQAKAELGIGIVITDDDWYDYLKLLALFLKKAGYTGMLVLLDELVNIYKIPNTVSRQNNYEKMLTMYNDALQGKAQYIGFILSGTPQCMEDTRRGVFSYDALKSRLQTGRFSRDGMQDLLAPIIRLEPLSVEEMIVLVEKLADIHAQLYDYTQIVTEEDMISFIKTEYSRIGAGTQITPREIIRDFIEVLDIVMQNPEMPVAAILGSSDFVYAETEVEEKSGSVDVSFAEFEI